MRNTKKAKTDDVQKDFCRDENCNCEKEVELKAMESCCGGGCCEIAK